MKGFQLHTTPKIHLSSFQLFCKSAVIYLVRSRQLRARATQLLHSQIRNRYRPDLINNRTSSLHIRSSTSQAESKKTFCRPRTATQFPQFSSKNYTSPPSSLQYTRFQNMRWFYVLCTTSLSTIPFSPVISFQTWNTLSTYSPTFRKSHRYLSIYCPFHDFSWQPLHTIRKYLIYMSWNMLSKRLYQRIFWFIVLLKYTHNLL